MDNRFQQDPKFMIKKVGWESLSSLVLNKELKPLKRSLSQLRFKTLTKKRKREKALSWDQFKIKKLVSDNELLAYKPNLLSNDWQNRRRSCHCNECTGDKMSQKQTHFQSLKVVIAMHRKQQLASYLLNNIKVDPNVRRMKPKLSKHWKTIVQENKINGIVGQAYEQYYGIIEDTTNSNTSLTIQKPQTPYVKKQTIPIPRYTILENTRLNTLSFQQFSRSSLFLPSVKTPTLQQSQSIREIYLKQKLPMPSQKLKKYQREDSHDTSSIYSDQKKYLQNIISNLKRREKTSSCSSYLMTRMKTK